MKRIFPIFLALLLLLTGCGGGPDILDNKTPADNVGALYNVGVPLPGEVSEPYLYALDGDLLFLTVKYSDIGVCDLGLHRMSGKTGQVTHSVTLQSAGYGKVQIFDGNVCLTSAPGGKVWILSPELEVQKEYSLPASYDAWYVTRDMASLFSLGWSTGLVRYDLATGSATQVLSPDTAPAYQSEWNDACGLTYVDPHTQMTKRACLDLTTGQLRDFPLSGAFSSLAQLGDLWVAQPSTREDSYLLGLGDTPTGIFTLPDSYLSLTEHGHILARNYITGVISLYDSQGRFESSIQLPMGEFGADGYISEYMAWDGERNGYFLLMTTFEPSSDGHTEPVSETLLQFWDLNVEVEGEDLALTAYDFAPQTPGGVTADPSLYERAAAMGERYGVTIRIADQCDTHYDNFDTYTVSDNTGISLALDELEEALSKYPDGFFEQLRYDTLETIEFNLTGTLTPLREDEFGTITAFAQPQPWKYIIVADLYIVTDTTFHHELSHVIDCRLAWDASHRPGALYSEDTWAAMNPAGFEYDWTYALHHDRWDFDMEYFMSSYALTYPTEDRATIWEQAMIGNDYPFTEFAPMREKLEYYCACVRDCFDTTGWPEVTPWEEALE